ncbi:MAG: hypothetical protein FJ126_09475 [Deltaproteobacteria bacterium]|nr:hypothetical protein [Deltaproteobacteria bacterium]
MAKRRTIGENPLDVTVQGNALDEVIPHRGAAPPGPDPARAALEAENQALKEELVQLKGQMAALEVRERVSRQRTAELEGENQGLKGELAQVQAALDRLKAEAEAAKAAAPRPDDLGYTFVRRGH